MNSCPLVTLVAKLMRTEDLQVVGPAPSQTQTSSDKKKSVTGRYPVLENAQDGALVCDQLPIARYLARNSPQFTEGAAPGQKAQIDTWVDYV